MGTFNEADHPRDDIGRFTFKNGGGDSSGSNVVLEGKVEKTDSTSGGGSSIGEKAGEILNIIVSTVTNPQVIQTAINIALTVKSAQEQHKLLKRLYENYKQEKKKEDRANTLYPSMKTKNTLNVSQQKNDSFIDKTIYKGTDRIIDNHYNTFKPLAMHLFPNAAENLDMAYSDHYLDTPFAHEHTIINNVKDLKSPLLRNAVEDKIKTQLEKDYGKNIAKEIKGIFFDSNSEPSKRLAKSSDIKKLIQENKEFIKDYGITAVTSIGFKNKDFHYAIGNADILDMYMDKNGEISFYVIDTYDFNKKDKHPAVRAARKHQESGKLKPYFMIYSVKIDKETASKYLK